MLTDEVSVCMNSLDIIIVISSYGHHMVTWRWTVVLRLWVDLEGWTEAGSRVGWRERGGGGGRGEGGGGGFREGGIQGGSAVWLFQG